MVEWIKSKLYDWCKPTNVWWEDKIPNVNDFRFTKDGNINKDDEYRKLVASLLDNRPFMQELAELETKYRKAIDLELRKDTPDWTKAQSLRMELKGVKAVMSIIASSHNSIVQQGNHNDVEN